MLNRENSINQRSTSIDIPPEEFRKIGYDLVDKITELLEKKGPGAPILSKYF